ncbi:MAG: hypothetical protein Q9182_004083 [Xanthomendoza sp. 2 TL-2023]
MPHMKKQKLCKDEATFVKGKPQAEVNYWPCEYQDEVAATEHHRYRVYPLGHIAEYCKHVPYRSEKKTFLSKTGREGFHGSEMQYKIDLQRAVFQYTFQMPNDEKRQTVMWDYNIGLVRITPFFKALGFPKTTPARMLGKNPGLKEICHNITGGSLAAQGYWMPFEAAKAVAATFCHRIRYVLTPIFGPDFPARCIAPGAPGFDSMHVAPQIILECTKASRECRRLGQEPQTPPISAGGMGWTAANIRPKALKMIGSETGYGSDTDTDRSDTCLYSPLKPAKCGFKGLATPRSSGVPGQYEQSYVRAYAPSQTGSESDVSNDCRKRKRNPPRYINEEYESSPTDSSEECIVPAPVKGKEESSKPGPMTDESAAKVMIAFSMTARVFDSQERVTGRRRASA